MADDSKPEDLSEIEEICLPPNGFQSRIPPYLLESKADAAERYILIEVSKFSHFVDWAAPIILATHEQTRKTNGRLKKLEAWRAVFTSWYGFIGAVLAVIGGVAGLILGLQTILGLFK